MANETFNSLAKGASLFLVGGILGGVLTYNTFDIENSSAYRENKSESNELVIETSAKSIEEKVYYTPTQTLSTVVSIDVISDTRTTGIFGEIFGNIIQSSASGSGVIYSEDENGIYIITNNHVVEGGDEIKIRLDDDDEGAEAILIGRDPSMDLAVIYVTKEELKEKDINDYLVSQIGNSDEIAVFDEIYAIGNAAGEGKSGVTGNVSALGKSITAETGDEINAIQIDAPINPGNSGGALINEKGQLIGINFAKLVGDEVEGMGYSIPINDAVEVANEIISKGTPTAPVVLGVESRPFMGVLTLDISQSELEQYNAKFDKDIVVVTAVVNDSPAFEAGITKGDIIKTVEGTTIDTTKQLQQLLSEYEIGDEIEIVVIRGEEEVVLKVTLGNSALYQN